MKKMLTRHFIALLGAAMIASPSLPLRAETVPASDILYQLHSFREMGGVMMVAAHPDDENNRLLAYLARGRDYRTAYLSLTRGDGGQNVLGPEIGDELGVIRTQELLAARRVDGARQFFTRAVDFGFSKDYKETFNFWGEQQILSDVVRVIRTFQPDVLVTRFSTQPGNTHGHHTASAILAVEAFKIAGDTNAFPDQLKTLKPWQPKRILQNSGFGRRGGAAGRAIRMDVSGNNPLTGESYSQIAGHSRSMHKTQGVGAGGGGDSESFQLLDGAPATNDIMDGIDTTWNRVPGGAQIGAWTTDVIEHFDPQHPSAGVPALVRIHRLLDKLPSTIVLDAKRRQLDRIIQDCLGLTVQTTLPDAEVVPGETMSLRHTVDLQAPLTVRWLGVRYPGAKNISGNAISLIPNQPRTRHTDKILPAATPLTTPYWLREKGTAGLFRVDDPSLIGRPENPPIFPMEQVFQVEGETFEIPDQPVQLKTDPKKGEVHEPLRVIAPVTLRFVDDLQLFPPGASRPAIVEIKAFRAKTRGTLRLQTPPGWQVTPSSQPFSLAHVGQTAQVTFTITAPSQTGTAELLAAADINGKTWDTGRIELRYEHIPLQLLQPLAQLKAVSLDLAIRGHNVGYIPGAGDLVAQALTRMGYAVTQLTGADLTPEHLRGLDAIVVGIRAFNVRHDLEPNISGLFDFAKNGGNVIILYNRPAGRQSALRLAPYDLTLSGGRVTDETAPMTLLAPENPVFTTPNKITPADFDGWVQERGAYFASQWDPHFVPLLSCHDPGEQPLDGSLLVAPYGRGHYTYTALSWFRQLPDGVPGAYRLFANLVSLGK